MFPKVFDVYNGIYIYKGLDVYNGVYIYKGLDVYKGSNVYKLSRHFSDPVTDHKKKSKKGRLVLIKQDGEFQTVREEETTQEDEMFLIFENGELVKDWSLSEVRARAWSRKSKD